MRGSLVALLVIGTAAFVAGGVLIGVGIHNNSKNEVVVTNTHTLENDFTDIKINLETASLYIKQATDDKVTVVCNERKKTYHDVKIEDGKLVIKQVDKRRWYEKFLFSVFWADFDVTVYLPGTSYANYSSYSATGKTEIDSFVTFNNVDITASTGSIKVNSTVTNDIKVNNTTGSITVDGIGSPNSVNLKNSTGSIKLLNTLATGDIIVSNSTGGCKIENVTCQNIKATASTGSVNLDNVQAVDNMELKSSTGGVRFYNSDANYIKASTSTGSIKGSVLTGKMFTAKSDTGSVHVPPSTSGTGTCELKSSTGSINVEIVE